MARERKGKSSKPRGKALEIATLLADEPDISVADAARRLGVCHAHVYRVDKDWGRSGDWRDAHELPDYMIETFQFIWGYVEEHGCYPTVIRTGEWLGISAATVHSRLRQLEMSGCIKSVDGHKSYAIVKDLDGVPVRLRFTEDLI